MTSSAVETRLGDDMPTSSSSARFCRCCSQPAGDARDATTHAIEERQREQGRRARRGWRRSSRGRAPMRAHIDAPSRPSTAQPGVRRELRSPAQPARGAGLSPGVLAHGVRRDQLPALLRRQRSRRPSHGGSARVRRHARAAARSGRTAGSSPASASIIPTGSSIPAAYFQSLQAAAAERLERQGDQLRLHRRREDSRPRRAAARRLARARHDRLRLAEHDQRPVRAPGAADELRRMYREFTGQRAAAVRYRVCGKRLMMRTAMASELNVLARALNRISETDRRFRDFTLNSLRRALVEVIACFPVYRTYVTRAGRDATRMSRWSTPRSPKRAGGTRCRSRRSSSSSAQALLPPAAEAGAAIDRWRDRSVAFAHKFQQYTAPVVAKGARGHGVLQRRAAAVGQRGRRRPAPSDPHGRRVPQGEPASADPLAARDDGRARRTTPSVGKTRAHGST